MRVVEIWWKCYFCAENLFWFVKKKKKKLFQLNVESF